MNHGPGQDDGLFGGPEDPFGRPDSAGGADSVDPLDSLGGDELALRRLLHEAVEEIEPSNGTLEHLRRAVPARRARKRQAVVGMAAAALFIGMAIPALVHVTGQSGSDDRPSIAGNSEATHGGTGSGKGPDGGESGTGSPSGKSKSKDKDGKKDKPGDKGKGAGGGATGGPDPASTAAASSPVCGAADLGGASANVGAADAGGNVYGSFRVTNVSQANCSVDAPGAVSVVAQGAADPAKVNVVDHTAGDAATGLPDPSTEPSQLILEPGMSYEVRFAWVPSAECPTTGGGGDPSPSPTPSGGTTGDATGSNPDQSGLSTQLVAEGPTADGSVAVSHTAEPGTPSSSTTIPNACSGTVYRTGVLPAS
ncbi:hypothetical protein OG698_23135 [Streptomyces sp. NBC_01003]|uniref:hypothetical protein n=1 Tax=Streptomyces sp. NBC_01003 TaxID=2903714 RepID=UPI00386D50F8|nr:hypothetical protein OG698_23135 [Streptomyces sp. NBC_01003]